MENIIVPTNSADSGDTRLNNNTTLSTSGTKVEIEDFDVGEEELVNDDDKKYNYYTVSSYGSDEGFSTLWDISKDSGFTIEEIKAVNPEIKDDNIIHPGQVIKVPIEVIEEEILESVEEPIVSGETVAVVGKNKNSSLWEISQNYGVSIEEIKAANPEIGADNIIHPNQEIIIPIKEVMTNKEIDAEKISEEKTKEKEVEEIVVNSTDVKTATESDDLITSSSVRDTFSNYRITSYHPGDGYASGTVTGSGKSINDFETMDIDGKRVYTYNGKIVVAAATNELMNEFQRKEYTKNGGAIRQEGKHYFNYYDEFTLTINGKNYEAIVLDSCGAAMWEGEYRIDLYVPSSSDVIDTTDVVISDV